MCRIQLAKFMDIEYDNMLPSIMHIYIYIFERTPRLFLYILYDINVNWQIYCTFFTLPIVR